MPAAPDPLFLAFQSAVAGRYSLDRELGRGGMGVVYLANEVDLDRPVAIKLLPPERAANQRLKARFLQEARTSAKLSHPNIIPIHAVDEVGDFVFFAMAYVDGETLSERVRTRGPLPPSEAARVLREVAWALAHAHAHGVVHRDVKPDNILLEHGSGRALVADFGIAAAEESNAGEISGTPEFMSPEQALGKPVDARSDLYAFGVTAYYAISGKLPFHGRTATEVLAKQVNALATPLATAAGALPRKLAQTVERCMAKRPSHRPKSAEAVAEEFGAALEQRRELPVALRAFVKRSARLDGPGVLVYPLVLGGGATLLASVLHSSAAALGAFFGGMTVVPLGVLVNRARRLLKLGFGHADLEPAFKAEIERGREERALDAGVGPSLGERVLRAGSVVGWFTFAVGLAFGINEAWQFSPTALAMMSLRRDRRVRRRARQPHPPPAAPGRGRRILCAPVDRPARKPAVPRGASRDAAADARRVRDPSPHGNLGRDGRGAALRRPAQGGAAASRRPPGRHPPAGGRRPAAAEAARGARGGRGRRRKRRG